MKSIEEMNGKEAQIVQLNLDVEENIRRQLKTVAAMSGVSLKELASKVLSDYVKTELKKRGLRPFDSLLTPSISNASGATMALVRPQWHCDDTSEHDNGGDVAHLVERLNGIQKVASSILAISTSQHYEATKEDGTMRTLQVISGNHGICERGKTPPLSFAAGLGHRANACGKKGQRLAA